MKIRRKKEKILDDGQKEILRLAEMYPQNTKMQNYKRFVLKKNDMINDLSDEDELK